MIALDSSFVLYAEGLNDDRRRDEARALIASLDNSKVVIPAQMLGELYWVLVRKARRSPDSAAATVVAWRDLGRVAPTLESTMLAATDLARAHGLQIWDAVIFTAAAEAGARVLLTEDLQNGFLWRGVTVVHPFAPSSHLGLIDGYRVPLSS